jgi:hypothetical protein
MGVKEKLSEYQTEITADWFKSAMSDYSDKTAAAYTNSRNQFANPVGTTISKAMELIVGNLINEEDNREEVKSKLEEVVRIRALQDFPPSKSLEFMFRLKDILLKYLGKNLDAENIKELLKIEAEIDRLAQISFDTYVKCREKLFELRNKEIQNQAHILLKRANIDYSFDKKMSFSSCK